MSAVKTGELVLYSAVAIGALWLFRKGPFEAGATAGRVIVDAATGVVVGIGDALGVPRTDPDRCAQAIAAGDVGAASAYCDALTFTRAFPGLIIRKLPSDIPPEQVPDIGDYYGTPGA